MQTKFAILQNKTPAVEEVQDIVEKVLVEAGQKTAKAYILYRADKTKLKRQEVRYEARITLEDLTCIMVFILQSWKPP